MPGISCTLGLATGVASVASSVWVCKFVVLGLGDEESAKFFQSLKLAFTPDVAEAPFDRPQEYRSK